MSLRMMFFLSLGLVVSQVSQPQVERPPKSYNDQTRDSRESVQIHRPRNLQEAQDVIRQAHRNGTSLRPLGASHSTNSVVLGSGEYISTENFDLVGRVEKSGDDFFVEVGSGTRLGDLADQLNEQGYSLGLAFPAYRGLTIGGLLATGSHGSALKRPAVAGQLVQSLTLVGPDGRSYELEKEARELRDRELFQAANLSLGALGFVTQVRLKVVPQFGIRVLTGELPEVTTKSIFKVITDSESEQDLINLGLRIFPSLDRVVVERSYKVDLKPGQRGRNVSLGFDDGIHNTDNPGRAALRKGRASAEVDKAIAEARSTAFFKQPPFQNFVNGEWVNGNDVTGPSHTMTLSIGEDRPLPLRDTSFMFPVGQTRKIIKTIFEFSKKYNYSFPIAGIYLRFARSDGGKSSLISPIEQHSSEPQLMVLAEFLEFFERDSEGKVPALSERDLQRQELVEALIQQGVTFHWGKNNDHTLMRSLEFQESMHASWKKFSRILNEFAWGYRTFIDSNPLIEEIDQRVNNAPQSCFNSLVGKKNE